jgi:hypothetical protein
MPPILEEIISPGIKEELKILSCLQGLRRSRPTSSNKVNLYAADLSMVIAAKA